VFPRQKAPRCTSAMAARSRCLGWSQYMSGTAEDADVPGLLSMFGTEAWACQRQMRRCTDTAGPAPHQARETLGGLHVRFVRGSFI